MHKSASHYTTRSKTWPGARRRYENLNSVALVARGRHVTKRGRNVWGEGVVRVAEGGQGGSPLPLPPCSLEESRIVEPTCGSLQESQGALLAYLALWLSCSLQGSHNQGSQGEGATCSGGYHPPQLSFLVP